MIHSQPNIGWHGVRQRYFEAGLKAIGIPYEVTDSRHRIDDCPAILLGTSMWRDVERTGKYLLVDRCSFGDTNKWVQLVWNGHGRRGDHKASRDPSRWESMGVDLQPWRSGRRVVLCGQVDTWSPHYAKPDDWYRTITATHFRPHPAGYDTAPYPIAKSFEDATAVTLNSSIGVQCVLNGIPTVTMDEGAMAWEVTSHVVGEVVKPPRIEWCHWLAWTQWTDDEIKEGTPWRSLL